MSPLLLRLALGGAGLFVAGGVALRVVPALPPSVSVAAANDVAAAEPARGPGDSTLVQSYTPIIENSIFSPERTAPAERFVPPKLAAEPRSPQPPGRTPQGRSRAAPRLRLVGTAIGPTGSVAIIDVDPAVPGAEVFRVGDRIGTARVLEIRENAVVLETPEGRITLTLPPSIRRSP